MTSRERFEAWYAESAFDYEANPIGSRECGLQWAAWQASRQFTMTEAAEVCRAKIDAEYKTGKVDHHEMAWCQSCEFAILALRDKGDE